MIYNVYTLQNKYSEIIYIGCSKNIKDRIQKHINTKPKMGHSGFGKFYKEEGIELTIVNKFTNISDARKYEGTLKELFGFEWTEKLASSKGGKKGGKIGGIKGGKTQGRKNIGNGIIKAEIPISAYNKESGEYIGTYSSITECSKSLNINRANICTCLIGKRKSAGGYTFTTKSLTI